ncbi:cysteine desulfurase [Lactobacillus acidophilus]|uniref:aminotransferase class V-fold PLP-dependent enzyme n=1 Tax=Lactobacillus acidophilus TaxID=1579 RepID=UPI000F75F73E|nr:cysteine desulfurase [Lactobacillus acidophilus]AZN77328.1 cysteine desulfurase [Lactobacillus acidophilus]
MDKRNITEVRNDFPILNRKINNSNVVYLDNAATTQMALPISKKMMNFWQNDYANVHRSVDTLGFEATTAYENAREKVGRFINAQSSKEIVFTSGATDSLNLVAYCLGNSINAGDEILLSVMEHHSNLLPWQIVASQKGARLKFVNITPEGNLDLNDFQNKLTDQTKIVAITHVSNVLGTINPIKQIVSLAHEKNALVVVDGAQAVGHFPVDVQNLQVDFYAFSGHKMLGPSGIGVLYGKENLLKKIPPYRVGGEMISNVTLESATWADIPQKFEAGTPNILGAIGLGYAIDYLNSIGLDQIVAHEQALLEYLLKALKKMPEIKVYGPTNRSGVVSFNLKNVHPHDLATALDQEGIEIRAGHHCAQPLIKVLGEESVARASLQVYNNKSDLEKFIQAIKDTEVFYGIR